MRGRRNGQDLGPTPEPCPRSPARLDRLPKTESPTRREARGGSFFLDGLAFSGGLAFERAGARYRRDKKGGRKRLGRSGAPGPLLRFERVHICLIGPFCVNPPLSICLRDGFTFSVNACPHP